MALATEFGLTDYPAPAGGCLLTEPNYSFRLRELLDHDPAPSLEDLALLRLGRHFRLSPKCKVIVGRDEEENKSLLAIADNKWFYLIAENCGSPVTVIRGEANEDIIQASASICARYSSARTLPEVDVGLYCGHEIIQLKVVPANDDILKRFKIEKRNKTVM